MKDYNEISFKFKAKSENEKLARNVVAGLCTVANPTINIIGDIKTAVSEAVTNAIVHGYNSDESKDIVIDANISDSLLTVTVTDNGIGMDDLEMCLQTNFSTKFSEERSGIGFTIMQSFMDTLCVISHKGNGTVVKMTKNLVS